ncbi:HTH domain-containing protein [Salinirarus marinus]|uniref:HTH domain-containing protein n=1 Tax=Salinirarus marinus TaxID=3068310 RepID=UPI003C6C8658
MILNELTETADRRIELHVRADDPAPGHHSDVVETLRELDADGRIDGFDVSTWPERATLSPDRPGVDVVDAYEHFQSWASERGVSINPPFVVRTGTRTLVGDEYAVLRTPTACLAVYDGFELVGVFPCVDGDTVHTVDDALSTLESTTRTRRASPEGSSLLAGR